LEPGSDAQSSLRRSSNVRLWLLVVLVAVLVPVFSLLSTIAVAFVTNSLDPASQLGVSDTFLNAVLFAWSGLLAGLFAGLLARMRGWALVAPPMAGLIVGLAIYSTFVVFESPQVFNNRFGTFATVWIGQVVAIVLATRLAGYVLAGAVGVLVVVGIGAVAAIQAVSERPAEVLLVLQDYTSDEPAGECRGVAGEVGAGELQIAEGSRMLLLELSDSGSSSEVGSVVLPAGTEGERGCVFELGDLLGRSRAEYENTFLALESDPWVQSGTSFEGGRVIFTMGIVGD
jgi:hypothetical protein